MFMHFSRSASQTFCHTIILFRNGLLLNPSDALPSDALTSVSSDSVFSFILASSSSSPIFHALTNHRHTAAPTYMKPVNSMAPV